MTAIGPTFGGELRNAGVPLDGILWYPDGTVEYAASVTDATKAQVASVLAAHDPTKPVVPQSVARSQAKIQLLRSGLLDQVKTAVAAADAETQLWFDEALEWRRDNAHVVSLGAALNLTSDQIDSLFIAAAAIN